jgi:hypothetical protein
LHKYYSKLSATIGSTRVARRAGNIRKHAIAASKQTAHTIAIGSR